MIIFGSCVGVFLGIIACMFCLYSYAAYSALALVPLVFSFCFPILLKIALKSRYSVFYLIFTATTFLRYVVHPVLVAYFREYSEVSIATQLSLHHMTNAAYMMCYELIVCTIAIFYIWRRSTIREERNLIRMNMQNTTNQQKTFEIPESTDIYKLLILATFAMVVLFPEALKFFSFATISFGSGSPSQMGLGASVTIIFIIASKLFAHVLFMIWCKKKSERSISVRKKYALIAAMGSFAFGCFYYGVNRAMIIFSLLAALFIYRMFFDDFWKAILVIGGIAGGILFVIITERRNYYDYMTAYSGIERSLRSAKMTINAYLGGVTNVGVSIVTMERFGERATIGTFILELLTPIVGLNRLLPSTSARLAGSYFNEVFFANTTISSQIIPTIGHGMMHLGYLFAPLFDVLVLWLYSVLERLRTQSMRIEFFAMFLIISMRMGMMLGVNITIINNEISMQILFPLLIFWLNNKIRIKAHR